MDSLQSSGMAGLEIEMGIQNGNFRILKWRYGEDHIFGRMFYGDIPQIGLMYGTSNQSVPKSWPLIQMGKLRSVGGFTVASQNGSARARATSMNKIPVNKTLENLALKTHFL